jgi:hypothetical protein
MELRLSFCQMLLMLPSVCNCDGCGRLAVASNGRMVVTVTPGGCWLCDNLTDEQHQVKLCRQVVLLLSLAEFCAGVVSAVVDCGTGSYGEGVMEVVRPTRTAFAGASLSLPAR